MTWVLVGLAVAVLLAAWLTWTATRLDRLHARCDAAWASLDAQLVRRAAAARAVADETDLAGAGESALHEAAIAALQADRTDRAYAENTLSARLADLAAPTSTDHPALVELEEACVRVRMARTFYNDAVRDDRTLRGQWLPRATGLGRRTPAPEFFDIDDTPGVPLAAA